MSSLPIGPKRRVDIDLGIKRAAAVATLLLPFAFAGIAFGKPPARPSPLPTQALETIWPARIECPRFERLDVAVDERVAAVEWRAAGGASRTFEVSRSKDPDEAWEDFRKGSNALDGVLGIPAAPHILYPTPNTSLPAGTFRAARFSEQMSEVAHLRGLDHLSVRAGSLPPTTAPRIPDIVIAGTTFKVATPTSFGLVLTLRCADRSHESVQWVCDASSCVPRVFRRSSNAGRSGDPDKEGQPGGWAPSQPIVGPYGRDWHPVTGKRSADLTRLLCARPTRADAAAKRKYRKGYLECDRWPPLADQAVTLGELAHDVVGELAAVLDFGCAGACSPALEHVRALARGLLASSAPLRLLDARGEFDRGEFRDDPKFLGWVARLGHADPEVELACDRFYALYAEGKPPRNDCRLTLLEGGRRLVDYYPDAYQQVELPDRGALHPLGSGETFQPDDVGGDVVIIGSALATAPSQAK
jgi:hypothetical protein